MMGILEKSTERSEVLLDESTEQSEVLLDESTEQSEVNPSFSPVL